MNVQERQFAATAIAKMAFVEHGRMILADDKGEIRVRAFNVIHASNVAKELRVYALVNRETMAQLSGMVQDAVAALEEQDWLGPEVR